jgi:hypothetical protein
MKRLCVSVFVVAWAANASPPNLLPNGDAETQYVNLITADGDRATSIQADDTRLPTHWVLSSGATQSDAAARSGRFSIRMEAKPQAVTAALRADFWKVKDPDFPFGLPLVPGEPITTRFYYMAENFSEGTRLVATITCGTIDGRPTQSREIPLQESDTWAASESVVTLEELHWGASVAFTLTGGEDSEAVVYIDDVSLTQAGDEGVNLIRNPGFEHRLEGEAQPPFWQHPREDQWVSWVGDGYRPPVLDDSTTALGRHALRADVTYGEVSGIAQDIVLNQEQPRPVVFGVWSKLNNSVSKAPPGYSGCENIPNLFAYVYHTDGSMQTVTPTFSLGQSDHDWRYLRGGFVPEKPIEKIRLQATLVGSEPTTSLWLDEVTAYELDENGDAYATVGAPLREISAGWGEAAPNDKGRVRVASNAERLSLFIPKREGGSIRVYLNTNSHRPFPRHERYSYHVIRIDQTGACALGTVVEKLGHVAEGQFVDATAHDITLIEHEAGYTLAVPFGVLRLDSPLGLLLPPIGFNVAWGEDTPVHWTGRSSSTEQLGVLHAVPPPQVVLQSIRFGNRFRDEPNQAQDLVSHPAVYAGSNTVELTLTNRGPAQEVSVPRMGQIDSLYVEFAAGETKRVSIPYGTSVQSIGRVVVAANASTSAGWHTEFPVAKPPVVEAVLDQEFYFPEEKMARLEIHNRYRPIPQAGYLKLRVWVHDSEEPVYERTITDLEPVQIVEIPIGELPVHDLPQQDCRVTLRYFDERPLILGEVTVPFGRINRTKRRTLPPIQTLRVETNGRLIINDDFRFFPIVPSVAQEDWFEPVDLGANMRRPYYTKRDEGSTGESMATIADETWAENVYTMILGPGVGLADQFDAEADALLQHPGILGSYAKQFYYWRLPEEFIDYRKQVEGILARQPNPRLMIWGHHDASFLYDQSSPPWPDAGGPVGYCYTKIMGRPGSAWRNAPFLTQIEDVLSPDRFKLAEVNFYAAWHDDEIVPEHFMTYYGIRGDDWRAVRNECYQAIIAGANGMYQYLCTQPGGIQRLRGWFQEMNHMWPVYVADDAPNAVTVTPVSSGIVTRLKRWQGHDYLLTANVGGEEVRAHVDIEGYQLVHAERLFEATCIWRPGRAAPPCSFRVGGSGLRDTWGANQAHVYRLTPSP